MLLLLPLIAAALRGGALPGWSLPPEAALLVVPLRILWWERGGSRWGDYLGGVVHVLLYFRFLHNVFPFLEVPVALILGLWWLGERALYFGLRERLPVALAGALAVVAVEWFRFHWPMGGVPWGSLALGLAERPLARNWASVIGESGLIVLVGLLGAMLYSWFTGRRRPAELLPGPILLLTAVTVVAPPAEPRDTIRTLSVQGNLSIEEKHGGDGRWTIREVFGRQAEWTWRGLAEEPEAELILWSETMYPYPVTPAAGEPQAEGFMIRPWPSREDMVPTPALRDANAANVRLLLGDPTAGRRFVTGAHFYMGVEEKEAWRPGEPRDPDSWSPRTSEFLVFGPDGRIEDHFSKTRLVPFGERLPFAGRFPGAETFALEVLRLTGLYPRFAHTGRLGPLETGDGHVLGGAVCWENVYEGPFRAQADRGAEAFLILSNENWYRISEEMDQMVAATRYRAAETGRPTLRVANTGITGLFDGRGALLGSLPRGEAGWFGADLARIDGSFRTPYQQWGWLLQPLAAWVALVLSAFGWLTRRRAQGSPPPEEAPSGLLDPSPARL